MPRTFTASDSVVIAASPTAVYGRISRPALMGRWSPENPGATVRTRDGGRGGAPDTYVGMVFDGHDRRGRMRWTTRCTVTAADADERFAFRVHAIGIRTPRLRGPIAGWEYRLEAVDGGTRVTETWTDDRRSWPDAVANLFDRVATSGHTFADFQARNIHRTLSNLKRVTEGPSAAAD
ncbi:Polyketide cyclase / dehydrase and lipid transport [Streptomyces sp. S4.7]|uniref:SRPBCC family protein n=1 Tax=Streptomyces sp. S4.7 TaxID=2705439 RepID=UPI00139763EC|nr:SRPBCC family protein [Streptomyces sp. S4.7]QHY93840.1 Polyketide cyclase / dehydrase and lipid transport [Streptomyces sp. S4.7]